MNGETRYHPDDFIGYLMGRAEKYARKRLIQKFRQEGYNITGEQWHLLMHLYMHDGQRQKDLALVSDKNKVSIARTVTELEGSNHVVRIPDETDLRSNKVYLTPKGKKLREPLAKIAMDNFSHGLKGLSKKEIETLKKCLLNIIDIMKP